MISCDTLNLVWGLLRHPQDSVYAALRQWKRSLNIEREELVEKFHQVRNLALSLPADEATNYAEEIDFLRNADLEDTDSFVFPYRIVGSRRDSECSYDKKRRLPYVVHQGNRLYFCHETSLDKVKKAYLNFVEKEGILGSGILKKSPHAYVTDNFKVEPGDTIIDVGCSEGLFTLDNIELARRAYVFESQRRWRKPLEATFGRFKDKVTIINKFVGSKTSRTSVRLSDVLTQRDSFERFFVKMDIEGGERDVLDSSRDFLLNNKVKLVCCVYHRQGDEQYIVPRLKDMGFSVAVSPGYMLVPMGGIRYPYFRHGVVYASNY